MAIKIATNFRMEEDGRLTHDWTKITPKQYAAVEIDSWICAMHECPPESTFENMTEREIELVNEQIHKYRIRIEKLLGFKNL